MRNIKLTIQYDGTKYHGFQIQSKTKDPTIQGTLEERLSKLTKEEIKIIGAGRTDAGVHARGQVVNFTTASCIPIERLILAANSVLPRDIVSINAEEVPMDFNARFSAIGKVYSYSIYNAKVAPVFERLYAVHIPQSLDMEAMQKAAINLLGIHDFSSFRSSGASTRTSVRNIKKLDLINEGPIIKLIFEADGFLYNMVRIITGTLIKVGKGAFTPEHVKQILLSCDRKNAGPTALAKGLCLEKVFY